MKYDRRAAVLKEHANPLRSATAAAVGPFYFLSTHDSDTSTHKIMGR